MEWRGGGGIIFFLMRNYPGKSIVDSIFFQWGGEGIHVANFLNTPDVVSQKWEQVDHAVNFLPLANQPNHQRGGMQ